jgi:hypothetical protein
VSEGERQRFAWITRKHVPGLGFERGLLWEIVSGPRTFRAGAYDAQGAR